MSVNSQLELLCISKGAYYYHPKGETAENLEIMKEIDKEHTEHPTKGVEGMVDHLFLLGFLVGPKRVRRLMHKMSSELSAIQTKGLGMALRAPRKVRLEGVNANGDKVEEIIRDNGGQYLNSVSVTDIYDGIISSITLRLCFSSPEKTLSMTEIQEVVFGNIVPELEKAGILLKK